MPFAATVGVFLLAFYGMVVVVPVIIGYTVFAYRVFWGKAIPLYTGTSV